MATFTKGFARQARLLTSAEFNEVFNAAEGRSADERFAVLARRNQYEKARLGLAISKKRLRRAVDRNRVKRLVRESFREHQDRLAGLDIVVINRDGLENRSNSELMLSLAGHWDNRVKRCKQP